MSRFWRGYVRKPNGKRPFARWFVTLVALLAFTGSGVIGFVYQTTDVPRPEDVQTSQFSTIYYSDGKTEMARLGEENRTLVKLSAVPKSLQHAVLAAENRSFYTDPGFSPSGIARAAWTNLTQGSSQGGSTITQQYVKKTYLTDQKTLTRKFKELIIAIKLEKAYTKDQILEFYLNTIYYGRGAYGIEAASETYFGKPVGKLSVAEGAVLASSIRSPAGYDPQNHPQAAKERWDYVVNGMVKGKWLTAAEKSALKYPVVQPITPGKLNRVNGPEGIIIQRVKDELAKAGISEEDLYSKGLKVVTTISKGAQDIANATMAEKLANEPKNLIGALVSIEPATGKVLAYFGNPQGTGFDRAGRGYRQPGSSFKPFALAAALENGYSVNSITPYGGSTETFPDRTQPVRNSGGASCGGCTLKQAITQSLNTVFYGLAYDVGPAKVAATAHAAGIGKTNLSNGKPTLQEPDGKVASGIAIGQYEVTVQDQASAFGTFANKGIYNPPYMVQKVTDSDGGAIFTHKAVGKQTVPAEVANDVSFALDGVAQYSNDPLADGRPVAAKTGTVQLGDANNKDAWMVGYTPQVSTAVWIGTEASEPIINAEGRIIYGAGIPGKIWQAFMDGVLNGAPVIPLPTEALITATVGPAGNGGSGTTNSQSSAPETTVAPPSSESPAPKPSTPAPTTPPATPTPKPTPSAPSSSSAPPPGGAVPDP